MLTDLDDVLRKAGLKVVEVPGWKTRGRPGAFNPKGVLCHHTAGGGDGYEDAKWLAMTGRPDLAPPLAQLALSRNGTFYVLAAGRANHAGRCKAIGGLKAYPGQSYGDGNEQMIGIEAQNRGTDAEGWSKAQYDAYVKGVAALTRHYRWSIVFGHKETSTSGKTDPDFNMNTFRRDVGAYQEEDMPLTESDIDKVADEVWTRPVRDAAGNELTVGAAIGEMLRNSAASLALAKKQASVARPLTAAEIKAVVDVAFDEKIQDATVVLNVTGKD